MLSEEKTPPWFPFSIDRIWFGIVTKCEIGRKYELGRPIKCDGWASMWARVTGFTLSLIELESIYYVDLSQVDATQMNFSRGFPGAFGKPTAF